jgi:hypothetical protein
MRGNYKEISNQQFKNGEMNLNNYNQDYELCNDFIDKFCKSV